MSPVLGNSRTLERDFAIIVNRNLRDKGWTQKKLAKKCRSSTSYVNQICNARCNLTVETITKVCRALDTRVSLMEVGP